MNSKSNFVNVWDPLVRIGHWLLVLAFFTAYFTEDDFLTQHVWAGYVVGLVICVRLAWGFIGSRHARFTDFVRSPRAVLLYLKGLRAHRDRRYLGHNPAGGAMILALLLSVSGVVYSGLMVHAYENHSGPLAAWVADDGPERAASGKHESDGDDEKEEWWEEIHEFLANFTLLLIGLHVAGGLVSSYLYRENLIKAMFTGRKPALSRPSPEA